MHAKRDILPFRHVVVSKQMHHRLGPESFLDATRIIEPISYGNVAGWVAVCHSRYCIKTTKPILKLFGPSGSPIMEAFGTPYTDISGGVKYTGVGKIGDFRRISPFMSETVRVKPMVTMER